MECPNGPGAQGDKMQCPNGHSLQAVVNPPKLADWQCELCESKIGGQESLKTGQVYRCQPCCYQVCEACYGGAPSASQCSTIALDSSGHEGENQRKEGDNQKQKIPTEETLSEGPAHRELLTTFNVNENLEAVVTPRTAPPEEELGVGQKKGEDEAVTEPSSDHEFKHEEKDESTKPKKGNSMGRMKLILRGLLRRRQHFPNMITEQSSLPMRICQSYCMPTFSTLPVVTLLAVYLTAFYEDMGVSLSSLSFFIALARSLDVISDPLMSYITDACRSKWGRRRPFCISGCWFYAFFLGLLLSPPDLSVSAMSSWFGACYILFFLSNTYTTIPYDALGPEMTDNYNDRSKLFFYSGLYDGFGALVAITLPQFVAYAADLYVVAPVYGCDMANCYSDTGTGQACLPGINSGVYSTYNLGFNLTANPLGVTAANFSSSFCYSDNLWSGLSNYCDCIDECSSMCDVQSQRVAFRFVGFFFGGWFCIAMVNMFIQVKERCQREDMAKVLPTNNNSGTNQDGQHAQSEAPPPEPKKMQATPPLVPSLLNTFRNKAFVLLLPAWICDSVGFAILASMMVYFVRYVVKPEYQTFEDHGIDCNQGIPVEGEDSSSWECDTTMVLGASVTCSLVAAFLGTPFWLFVTKKLGKRQAWLLWSFTMSITNILYWSVGEGMIWECILLGGINGFPFGAKFLADAILSDIIDYDEFLTGQRNEATYTMFKSFLPKICAIPAAAIPLSVLAVIGHVPPVNGQIQEQPAIIATYCKIVSVIIPFCLALLGSLLKYQFPLKSKEECDKISMGIGLHILGESAVDPISGEALNLLELTEDERNIVNCLDYFPGTEWLQQLNKSLNEEAKDTAAPETPGLKMIMDRVTKQLIFSIVSVVLAFIGVIFTYQFLEDDKLSVFPVLIVIALGVSLTSTAFSNLRLRGAKQLERLFTQNAIEKGVLETVLKQRRQLETIGGKVGSKVSLVRDIKWLLTTVRKEVERRRLKRTTPVN
mmetsp:Transcript_37405/g.47692  ORF Transcript_37405/g.47692 Transcript_37405/m.47692 type:complete len:992 (+) Transcript_37405:97-3072(+)